MKRLGYLMLAWLLINIVQQQVQAQGKEPSRSVPQIFKFNTVGAPIMSSYTVEWDGRELKTTQSLASALGQKTHVRKPTTSEWQQFWNTMNAIGIWDWKRQYENSSVLDGTFWQITIKQSGKGGKRCNVMGRNAYPSDANAHKSSLEFEPSRRYKKFITALITLAGKIDNEEPDVPLTPPGREH